IADIRKLRKGYRLAADWTFEQNCWHLNFSTRARLRPGPYPKNTPEQTARAEILKTILATGQLPAGLVAPPEMVPPHDADESAIGNWTLPQAVWHLGTVHQALQPLPAGATSSDKQLAFKAKLFDPLLASGVMPAGMGASPSNDPCNAANGTFDAAEIGRFIDGL